VSGTHGTLTTAGFPVLAAAQMSLQTASEFDYFYFYFRSTLFSPSSLPWIVYEWHC